MGRDKNGYLKYLDFSYSNAYDVLLRPVNTCFNAIAEGANSEESMKEAAGEGYVNKKPVELIKPFGRVNIYTSFNRISFW